MFDLLIVSYEMSSFFCNGFLKLAYPQSILEPREGMKTISLDL